MEIKIILLLFFIVVFTNSITIEIDDFVPRVTFEDKKLKDRLTPSQYMITRMHFNEGQNKGKYYKHFEDGEYNCIVCNERLFDSASKLSIDGWATFSESIGEIAIVNKTGALRVDKSDKNKDETYQVAWCANCGSNLGQAPEVNMDDKLKRIYRLSSDSLLFVPRNEVPLVID